MGLTASGAPTRDRSGSLKAAGHSTKPGLAARQAAHRLLAAIVDARTPMDALTDDAHGHPHYLALEPRDRALVRAILMSALRRRGDLEALIDRFLDRPLPEGASSLRAIIHVALAQILFLDVPAHSAADLAVEAAGADPRNRRFARLVNAVARRAVRDRDRILSRMETAPARAPQWFSERLDAIYGVDTASAIEAAHRRQAPIDLTLADESLANLARWADLLDAIVLPTGSLRLRGKADIASLPGYAEGVWWVQDAASAIPARLFGPLGGKRALDLCAAPGGKTAQLASSGAVVAALDISANRLKRLEANMARLGLANHVETVATSLFDFAPDSPFDAVLLDAPCSSTGTVRRHPDVPWTKTDADIEKLAGLQARMFAQAAKCVTPGGMLIFSNCSLDPREGEDVTRAFLADNRGFSVQPIVPGEVPELDAGLSAEGFLRTTPADWPAGSGAFGGGGLDGFFVARLVRNP